MTGLTSWVLSRKYTDQSIEGIGGTLAGKNATISNVQKSGLITTITFQWTADNGDTRTTQVQVSDGETPSITITPTADGHTVTFETSTQTETFDVKDGISVSNVTINSAKHLIITLSNGSTIDAGEIETATELSELTDVELANLADKEVLTYDATSGKWVNKELDIAVNIVDLKDVDTTNLVNGSILKYNSTTGKFTSVLEKLDDISDVDATNPTVGQTLKFDGVHWRNQDNKIVDLKDVKINNLQNGQILVWDSVQNAWKNGSPSATDTSLDDLSNVNIDSETLTDGQVLVYDAENQVWVNHDGVKIDKLEDIDDIDINNITDGQIIVWDATNSKWVNADIATKLSELSDVQLGILDNLDMIRYNAVAEKWENFKADTVVTDTSTNVVTSGAVFTAIKAVDDKIGSLLDLKTTDRTTVVTAINEVFDALEDLITKVGNLQYLTTTDKSSIVNAINELVTNVGDLTTLTTTDKTSIVNAINEVLATVKALKYVEQVETMPNADTTAYHGRTVQYVGSNTADYTRGYFYRSTPSIIEGSVIYAWVRIDVQPNSTDYEVLTNKPQINDVELIGNKSLDDLGVNSKFQYSVAPTPDNTIVGKVIEYIGGNTADFKTGYFYQCQYVASDAQYKWIQIDVSSNAELVQRIITLETNQGDMSALTIPNVSDLVSAINVLAIRGIKSITYSEPYLTITLQDDTSFNFDITIILQSTDLGDLGNVIDTTIQNGNLLQYDASILKYKPYDVATVLSNLLQESKDYTDEQIASAVQDDAYICDAKPNCTMDSSTGKYIVVYYQNNVLKTTTAISSRFYYKNGDGDPYCISWFETGDPNVDPVAFEYLISTPDFDDYINRNTDVVSTYTTTMVDKSKIPDIAALDALYTIIATALGLKVNISDINDTLTSDSTTVPLSAKQGKVLKGLIDEKQEIFQMSTMPQVTQEMVTDNVIYQYIGADSQAYRTGRFYKAVYDSVQDIYSWQEVKFSADYDATILEDSTNAPQGGAVYNALELKQDKTLETPIVVEGETKTTVETTLNELNTAKAKKFQVTTMPTASIDNLNLVLQYIGSTTANFTEGYFYKCKYIDDNYTWVALTSKIDVDSVLDNTSTNPVENQAITNAIQAIQSGIIVVYPTEADRLTELNYSAGQIIAIGTICYCIAEESWYHVTAINTGSLAVTWSAYDPHIATDSDVEKRLEKVTALPTATVDTVGKIYLLTNTQVGYQLGGIYKGATDGSTYSWELISISPLTFDSDDFVVTNDNVALSSAQRIYQGTLAEWDALTTAEKAKYQIVIFTDDSTVGDGDSRKQPKTLESPIVIDGVTYSTVEGALQYMAYTINNLLIWNSGI